MSQATDYALANQSGANFRSELNSILAAVVSQNSGSSAPSTTYAYQLWIDTGVNPALLKLRNGANNAWITIGDVTAANLGLATLASPTFTGTVTIPSGASITGYLSTATAASTYLALAGGTVTGNIEIGTTGTLTFEGATADAFETTLDVVDPTADRSILLPNISGTVITTGDTGTVTSTMLLDGTILNADINASAAIAGSKIVAATTSVVGAVQLSDSTSTTSSVLAATPTAVKSAYDLANAAAKLNTAQSFTAQQRGTISALADGATITADFSLANNFSVTLGGNRTLANPTNLTAGASGAIWITQDGTGSRTLAYGSQWDFTGGTAPTLSTAASSVDCLVYAVQSSTRITATLITNLS